MPSDLPFLFLAGEESMHDDHDDHGAGRAQDHACEHVGYEFHDITSSGYLFINCFELQAFALIK